LRFEDARGNGINVALRIMSFAELRQLLVSHSYYDIVSCLLQEYAQLFQYKGVKADNHIREHDIYSMALKFLPFIHSSMSAEVGRNISCP
jgi:class 3 adenylate cyclase